VQAREAEWRSYSLPKTNFIRQTSAEKEFLFRAPADWKQQDAKLIFIGPHSAKLEVFVEKVSDGLPLPEYVAAIMRHLRNTPGLAESAILRPAQFQDLEAKEIVFELQDPEGEMMRSVLWVTVQGPLAVSFSLIAPLAHTAEAEPYFKAVVQSVMFVSQLNYAGFEALRTTAIQTSQPASIIELQAFIDTLNEPNPARESTIARLASRFASAPDPVVDLLLDRRPPIRAAAVEALAGSKNAALDRFLWRAVEDRDPLVAEAAARAVAAAPDVLSRLSVQSFEGFKTETIARVWPLLGKEKRIQILQTIFSQTATKPTQPPPLVKNNSSKTEVKVLVAELKAVGNGKLLATATGSNEVSFASARDVQLGALTLLREVKPDEFKLPLARIMAADYDVLTAAALQTAIERAEPLPTDLLLKLLISNDRKVAQLAAESLGLSGSVSEIVRIESLIASLETRVSDATKANGSNDDLTGALKLSIKKIRFRDQLAQAAKTASQSSREIIKQGLSDSQLADFVWRYVCEETPGACGPVANIVKPDVNLQPLAENLFPEKVQHFAALPNPGRTVQRFYESLQSIQMDSPRGQANLVLVMVGIRRLLGEQLAAPSDDPLIDYSGIKADAPVSIAAWIADGAPAGVSSARRQAVVLRVSDRERFERLVEVYQRNLGSFAELPDYLATGTRALAALPAILPLSAKAVTVVPTKPKATPLLKYSVVWRTEWHGLPIKMIEHREVDSTGKITNSTTCLTFLGDTAIVAPNLTTIRDLLTRAGGASKDQPTLASNPEFRRVSESDGDVVYFADLKSLFAGFRDGSRQPQPTIKESGELRISKSSWENFHRLSFDESDWAKSFISFQPGELSAPRDLLPSSTVAYYFMKADLSGVWSKWVRSFLDQKHLESLLAFWALDFEKEVLPELGPECGVALLDLPEMDSANQDATWLAFCKLRGDRLQNAHAAGKLFRHAGIGAGEIKRQDSSALVALKNGFLVFSNRAKGLEALDLKEKLASTRDYSRAAAKVPSGMVAFGGYNLEAAIAAAAVGPKDGLNRQLAEVISSLARAFHSQNFFATAGAGSVEAQSSVAMDREGRYAVSDLTYQPTGSKITYATVEARGIPIADQKRISSLALRIRARAAGAIERIRDDVKSPHQTIEQRSAEELVITVDSRRSEPDAALRLPINNPDFASFLKATAEIRSEDEQVVKQAREIAGDDRNAWSVARKLADWTHSNLTWKFVASADAGQTLATREADCSEFSQLYVAMARSLGLPARIVSGLAYGGTSFGGHAWVEVWAGRWIELDPTWGTHFVDATHIRNESGALLTYAALNLIELEVLEARRTIADFQLKPASLAEQLTKTIPAGDRSALEAVFDLAVATDALMGKGAWAAMNEIERDQMSSAYIRVILEVILTYGQKDGVTRAMRVLRVDEQGDQAEITCVTSPADHLLKFRLLRESNVWHLVEILQTDSNLHIVSETLLPTIRAIEDRRASRKPGSSGSTDFVRILLLQNKAQKAVEIADRALQINPSHVGLRYLKALGLLGSDKRDDAVKLLTELGNEQPAFAPALYKLARLFNASENEVEKKLVVDLYNRYLVLEPYDSRAYRNLASVYDGADNAAQAETAYRKAIEVDPTHADHYVDLVEFFIHQKRLQDAATMLAAADQHKRADEDLFGQIMQDLYFMEDYECAETFAASQPQRMKTSSTGNLNLALVHSDNGRYGEALRLLKVSAQLDPKSAEPLTMMAEVYRNLSRWQAAVAVADQSLAIEPENAEALYQRACALARLGRTTAAMAALNRSVELQPARAGWIAEEPDLKRLRMLPAFKKLVKEAETQK